MRTFLALSLVAILLSGCSTDRSYTVSHERMTTAAIQAIAEEAHVHENEVVRTDRDDKDGQLTYLECPYIDYSRIRASIDSRAKDCTIPEFSVKITTDKHLYTRHKEWEERIHELVFLKLRATKYTLSDPVADTGGATPRGAGEGIKGDADAKAAPKPDAKLNTDSAPKVDSSPKTEEAKKTEK